MKTNALKLTALSLILSMVSVFAQQTQKEESNAGVWSELAVEKKLNKWTIGGSAELRTSDFLNRLYRWNVGLSAEYSFSKHFDAGMGYDLINRYDQKYDNYSFRNRFNGFVTGKVKAGRFDFSLRERIQTTIKDDSKRVRETGEIDTYAMNPEWTWRNRLKVSYDIPKSKLTPYASAETFYQLNNPKGNEFETFRYIVGMHYRFNKQNRIEVYGLLNDNRDNGVSNNQFVIGLGYRYRFK